MLIEQVKEFVLPEWGDSWSWKINAPLGTITTILKCRRELPWGKKTLRATQDLAVLNWAVKRTKLSFFEIWNQCIEELKPEPIENEKQQLREIKNEINQIPSKILTLNRSLSRGSKKQPEFWV